MQWPSQHEVLRRPRFCEAGQSSADFVSSGGADMFVMMLPPAGKTLWGTKYGGWDEALNIKDLGP